jgi:asparagine synthase (glutamine-hydrolysing)
LSGGLDSSIITALAGRMNSNILTFTIYEENDEVGDRKAASELANLLRMRHHEIAWNTQMMLSASASLIDLEYLVWALDSPFGTLQYWSKMLACRAAKSIVPGIKVILIGQGSDEFSGGYTCGNEWQHVNADWDTFMRRGSSAGLPGGMKLLAGVMPGGVVSDEEWIYASQLQRRHKYLEKIILWCEDRAISSQGLECRVPFLDHRIVELLLSIPAPLRRTLLWDKEIVRRAAQRWLPAHLARRPKCGFIPIRDSILEAAAGSLCRMFPAFEEKYLWRPEALFDGKALRQVVARLEERFSRGDFQLLFRSMQFGIFNEQCQRPASFDYLLRYAPLD